MSKKEITARLKSFPSVQSKVLIKVRDEISKLLPGATEEIKYGIPTWTIEGIGVIGIDGFKNHNSLFPYSGNLGSDFSARGGRQLGIYGRARRIRLSLQVHPHERFSNRYL